MVHLRIETPTGCLPVYTIHEIIVNGKKVIGYHGNGENYYLIKRDDQTHRGAK